MGQIIRHFPSSYFTESPIEKELKRVISFTVYGENMVGASSVNIFINELEGYYVVETYCEQLKEVLGTTLDKRFIGFYSCILEIKRKLDGQASWKVKRNCKRDSKISK